MVVQVSRLEWGHHTVPPFPNPEDAGESLPRGNTSAGRDGFRCPTFVRQIQRSVTSKSAI